MSSVTVRKQGDFQQNVRQFVQTAQQSVSWIYKYVGNGGSRKKTIQLTDTTSPLYIYQDMYTMGTLYSLSDETQKSHIQRITKDDLGRLQDLVPVTYTYNDDPRQRMHYGLIAQQVERSFPTLVTGGEEYKHVNYMELIPLLLAKTQRLETLVSSQGTYGSL